jgi:hypothetical protein
MKLAFGNFRIVLLCSFLALGILGIRCKMEQHDSYAVSIFFNYWDGNQFFFIGSNEADIDSAFNRDLALKKYIPSIWQTEFNDYHHPDIKCILTPLSFKYLLKYINENCKSIERKTPQTIPVFTIHSYSEKEDRICTYYYNQQLIEYFKGMIQYMEKSAYKNDYKIVVDQIQQYIDQYPYYKHS